MASTESFDTWSNGTSITIEFTFQSSGTDSVYPWEDYDMFAYGQRRPRVIQRVKPRLPCGYPAVGRFRRFTGHKFRLGGSKK